MKKWMALALALVTVLMLAACGDVTIASPFQPESWGQAEGRNGKILGVWYNIQKNAGDETVYGFSSDGTVIYAKNVDAKEAYTAFYDVDEANGTVSFYGCDKNDTGKKGDLITVAQIVENGDVLYLIGEDIALAREADLEAARAAYPELANPAE